MSGLFDAHLHIIDPAFPLIENQGFLPDAFTCSDYMRQAEELDVRGGAVVSGSFQGYDQTYLIDSLAKLGAGFVGVTQLPHDVSDEELVRLHGHGVRAVRFNVQRGGSESLSRLDYFARRVHERVGWHTELYIDSIRLGEISSTVRKLPAVSVDHLGLSRAGFGTLLELVDRGIRVKATGFGRIDLDAADAMRSICAVNPEALMFGTDLPSTRAKRPFRPADIELIHETLGEKQAQKVLSQNALQWYMKK